MRLLQSKKFMAVTIVGFACVLTALLGVPEAEIGATLDRLVMLIMAYVVGQGLADACKVTDERKDE